MYKEARCLHCDLCRRGCDHPECQPFGRCLHICPENCLTVSGRTVEATTLAAELKRSAQALGAAFGGFTFSGGEPFAQPGFLAELIDGLKPFHLCIETSGFVSPKIFAEVLGKLDFVIMDLKLADPRKHQKFTGVDNAVILENFDILRHGDKPFLIRTPLISGITDTKDNLDAIRNIIGESDWEKIPYNDMAGAKYKMLGVTFPMEKPFADQEGK